MLGEIFQIGSTFLITGLLIRLREFVLSFEPGKGRKSDGLHYED